MSTSKLAQTHIQYFHNMHHLLYMVIIKTLSSKLDTAMLHWE